MSVKINRLFARQVETLPLGFHADGGGLYRGCVLAALELGCSATAGEAGHERLGWGPPTPVLWLMPQGGCSDTMRVSPLHALMAKLGGSRVAICGWLVPNTELADRYSPCFKWLLGIEIKGIKADPMHISVVAPVKRHRRPLIQR